MTNKEFDIDCGAFNSFDIRSGQPNTATRHNWRVWIDYDQNGSFENDEQVIYNHSVNMKGLVYIPSISKLTYRTGMRIAMSKDDIPNACGDFENGEVEDYTVVLKIKNFDTIDTQSSNVISKGITSDKINVYPNPSRVQEPIYLEYTAEAADQASITIFSIDGRLVESVSYVSTAGKNKIDLKGMIPENGVYLIKMQVAAKNFIKKITIID